ncbi:ABC transporter substrate-binding protein [Shouchella shacheensis]|uniref:ABC transporter substrate-binding protein n=1 Tax=Shouchella shacheensis TaxID=1649580 RepID=UPI00073FBFF1|nr:ABC transporter substrate-binding protein [Shouchella shacheensis]
MKKLGISVTAVASLLLVAGCGEQSDGVMEVSLTGWQASPTEQRFLDETIEAFEEKHPDIKVNFSTIPDRYMDIMRTRLIGLEGPDVFFLDAFEAPGLIETGALEPLDPYITEEFELDDFEQPLLEAFEGDDGGQYGLPKDTSTLALFYNKELFAEAGIESPPETWEELEEAAEMLTTDGVYGFGVAPELARLMFIAESGGGQVATNNRATFGDERVADALQPIVDMRNETGVAAEPSEVGSDNTGEMFAQGRAAMVIEGNWNITYLEENFPDLDYGVVEVPTINDQEGTMTYTVSYVMNQASEKKEAAWTLIEYLTGKEGMKTWTSSGFTLPTRASVAEELDYVDDDYYGPFVAGSAYATVWADDTNLPIFDNNFNNQFLSAFLGQRDLGEALQEAEDVANRETEQ